MPGKGSHLKVSHIDPRVCFGYELTNLSVRKSFFQIIAPYQRRGACLGHFQEEEEDEDDLGHLGEDEEDEDDDQQPSRSVHPSLPVLDNLFNC